MKLLYELTANPETLADLIVYAHFTLAFSIGLVVTGLILIYANKDN